MKKGSRRAKGPGVLGAVEVLEEMKRREMGISRRDEETNRREREKANGEEEEKRCVRAERRGEEGVIVEEVQRVRWQRKREVDNISACLRVCGRALSWLA